MVNSMITTVTVLFLEGAAAHLAAWKFQIFIKFVDGMISISFTRTRLFLRTRRINDEKHQPTSPLVEMLNAETLI
jgi:hypothetical protein